MRYSTISGHGCARRDGPTRYPVLAGNRAPSWNGYKAACPIWTHKFDWRAWERRLNALNHFIWEGIHFVYQRAASGRGVLLILTHGWPSSFLDYIDMLPMLEHFDVVVPSCPGMDSRRAHPRSASTTGTSLSAGAGSFPSLGIPAMVRTVMTLGLGSRRSLPETIPSR